MWCESIGKFMVLIITVKCTQLMQSRVHRYDGKGKVLSIMTT